MSGEESAQRTEGATRGRGRALQRARTGRQGLARGGLPMNPLELMWRMSEEMDQLFGSFGMARPTLAPFAQGGLGTLPATRTTGRDLGTTGAELLVPQIEVLQRPDAIVVRADLPGLRADDIDVSVDDGMLTISGERRQEYEEEREGVTRSEVVYGTFQRTIPLPDGADESGIAAIFRNGVLEIIVPIAERQRGRRVKVSS
ncbi:MAG TPA: Hsp20/alpha crystallin family protein [Gemmatimonadaceae bacterium]|nr:Hsp20/alpha crystallin family protein [Gemmatimonadaceae bacterium]